MKSEPIKISIDPTKRNNPHSNGNSAVAEPPRRDQLQMPTARNLYEWFILTYTYSAVLIRDYLYMTSFDILSFPPCPPNMIVVYLLMFMKFLTPFVFVCVGL